jgi:hypothetical protein
MQLFCQQFCYNISMNNYLFSLINIFILGARGSVVVKVLCYKPEGRGFEI